MSLFYPTVSVDGLNDITIELLQNLKVKALFLDVDDTLAIHGSQTPLDGSIEWVKLLSSYGIKLVIISNNFNRRVSPFAAKFGIPYMSFAKKPLPSAYKKAKNNLDIKLTSSECAIVGDQIFTDILGANLCGMKSILVDPVSDRKTITSKIKRKLESNIKRNLTKGEIKNG